MNIHDLNDEMFAVICAGIALFSEGQRKAKDLTKKVRNANRRRNGMSTAAETIKNERWQRNAT